MRVNTFSGLDLVVALDARNVEAHRTGALEGCVACATVSSPRTTCPAGDVLEATDAVTHLGTAIEIVERLRALLMRTT
jgi:hypothetical protein